MKKLIAALIFAVSVSPAIAYSEKHVVASIVIGGNYAYVYTAEAVPCRWNVMFVPEIYLKPGSLPMYLTLLALQQSGKPATISYHADESGMCEIDHIIIAQ